MNDMRMKNELQNFYFRVNYPLNITIVLNTIHLITTEIKSMIKSAELADKVAEDKLWQSIFQNDTHLMMRSAHS